MTPIWATVVLTLGGTLLGGCLALAATVWQSSRDAARQTAQLGSAALAGALATINDASPAGLSLNTSPAMLQHLEEVRERWQATFRLDLLKFSLQTDSDAARRLARDLAAGVPGLVNIAVVYVQMVLSFQARPGQDPTHIDAWQVVEAKHASLVKLSEELEAALVRRLTPPVAHWSHTRRGNRGHEREVRRAENP